MLDVGDDAVGGAACVDGAAGAAEGPLDALVPATDEPSLRYVRSPYAPSCTFGVGWLPSAGVYTGAAGDPSKVECPGVK
jgi:hypothetical protein